MDQFIAEVTILSSTSICLKIRKESFLSKPEQFLKIIAFLINEIFEIEKDMEINVFSIPITKEEILLINSFEIDGSNEEYIKLLLDEYMEKKNELIFYPINSLNSEELLSIADKINDMLDEKENQKEQEKISPRQIDKEKLNKRKDTILWIDNIQKLYTISKLFPTLSGDLYEDVKGNLYLRVAITPREGFVLNEFQIISDYTEITGKRYMELKTSNILEKIRTSVNE